MYKCHEQQKVTDTHMNQKVKNLIHYHKEDHSFEVIQKWNSIRFSQKRYQK